MDGTILDKKFGLSKKVKTLVTQVTNLQRDVDEVEEDVLDKTDRDNVAPEFSASSTYFIGDLVYYNGTLYEFTANHDGDWDAGDVRATSLDQIILELRSQSGGVGLKTLRYTGNGQAANVIDFGAETPVMIAGIYPDPDETYAGGDYNLIEPFGWGNRLTIAIWSGQSGGLPSGGGGTNMAIVNYSGNTMTITSANVRAACNVDTQKYVVKYLA